MALKPFLKGLKHFNQHDRRSFSFMLTLLLATLFLQALNTSTPVLYHLVSLSSNLVMVGAIYSISHHRRWLIIILTLSLPSLLSSVFVNIAGFHQLVVVSLLLQSLSYLSISLYITARLLHAEEATASSIIAGICLYLLLGFFWAHLCTAIEIAHPHSFTGLDPAGAFSSTYNRMQSEMFYFSFMVLTSVGFGDITPVTPLAEIMTVFMAVSGQLFVMITMASLMGRYLNEHSRSSE